MVRWADTEAVGAAVSQLAAELKKRPEVREVRWYGSWVSGIPTPSSDVDLCVVVESDDRRPRERIPDYLPSGFPTAIDLVVFTRAEFASLPERAPEWHRAITGGRLL